MPRCSVAGHLWPEPCRRVPRNSGAPRPRRRHPGTRRLVDPAAGQRARRRSTSVGTGRSDSPVLSEQSNSSQSIPLSPSIASLCRPQFKRCPQTSTLTEGAATRSVRSGRLVPGSPALHNRRRNSYGHDCRSDHGPKRNAEFVSGPSPRSHAAIMQVTIPSLLGFVKG